VTNRFRRPPSSTLLLLAALALLAPAAPAQESAPAAPPPDPAAPAAEAPKPRPRPRLVVDTLVHDAGRVRHGERVEARFEIRNEGEADLVIREVQAACGCTVASFDPRIPPEGSGSVRARLDTATLAGPVAKTITVLSNDPAIPRLVLTLRAEVATWVVVSPAYARLLAVQTEPAAATAVTLWNDDGPPIEIADVRTPAAWVSASARPAAASERVEGGPEAQWRIEDHARRRCTARPADRQARRAHQSPPPVRGRDSALRLRPAARRHDTDGRRLRPPAARRRRTAGRPAGDQLRPRAGGAARRHE
jgi:hypothetical protein